MEYYTALNKNTVSLCIWMSIDFKIVMKKSKKTGMIESKHFSSVNSVPDTVPGTSIKIHKNFMDIIPISQMRKLAKTGTVIAGRHINRKHQSWDLNPDSLNPEPAHLTSAD